MNINKQVAKVNSDSHITGLPKLSPDAKFCVFAAELKTEKKSFYDQERFFSVTVCYFDVVDEKIFW